MRRSVLILAVAVALLGGLSAMAYADSMNSMTSSAPGWLSAQLEGDMGSQVQSDAQKVIGDTVGQLNAAMGPTSLTSNDGKGGTIYYYHYAILGSIGNGSGYTNEWVDVGPDGKVLTAVTNVG